MFFGLADQLPFITIVFTEPAAMISKPILDIRAPEKDKVTFECELSRTNAEVKWFKVSNVQLCR